MRHRFSGLVESSFCTVSPTPIICWVTEHRVKPHLHEATVRADLGHLILDMSILRDFGEAPVAYYIPGIILYIYASH